MTLSEIRAILAEEHLQLTKSLGQNFLHDHNQLCRIVEAAELTPEDSVMEIGPGLGPLTELLLQRAGRVTAIEKDRRLCEVLRTRLENRPGFDLLHGDALEYLESESRNWNDWKVVSNLPYSVGSPILVALAEAPKPPRMLVVTLQWEVIQRLRASPGTKDYGILSLLIQGIYQPDHFFKIPSGCFFPQPDIDSGCIRLLRRDPPLLTPEELPQFKKVVKRSFSQRRKKMLKLLRADWPEQVVNEASARAGISPLARAESVSLEQFIKLSRLLHGWTPVSMNRGFRRAELHEAPTRKTWDSQGMSLRGSGSQSATSESSRLPMNPIPASSQDEVFDVVNDRDEVVGQKTRREVHELGLNHRAVHILVFNRAGQVFLQKRSMLKDRFPGAWDSSASGHVDAGEDYDTAARRELLEELGWSPPRGLQRLFKIDACIDTDQEFIWIYRCEGEGPFELKPDEIERGDWFDPAHVTRWITAQPRDFASGFSRLWREWIEHFSNSISA
ncbi:MAG TPA: 16S rRNA (adenine(1518)-N(6)/adenine(1519)-N(6))-dimethyltransferase RsmA [Candidatus Paceibacterota bacterium]|nr:16S rRNA (adenine(1518)-N(6)/adenine(1519)-N(6))-dimethyltransferase RsmA [Verrucomicrobiota bacterium]HRY50607.1 16S rRNA (adenine(1518)-N(6)/adenine(1519)-N(6))-dimethyltransferase RsmA [Candidatus Paceibacterota bacterium]HRZ99535.1 16S rRNA (adenine(1518)-N(6)/adenine(1519)-N(6))-dimethyltransferase RsmA [Candidatus Paceibacterota bacterium]